MIIGCLGMIVGDELERFAAYILLKCDHQAGLQHALASRMEEVENDRLMQSHTVLKEAVSRCCRDFRVSNHVPWQKCL